MSSPTTGRSSQALEHLRQLALEVPGLVDDRRAEQEDEAGDDPEEAW